MNIDTILKQLTLEEKAALLQGWSNWTSREIPRLSIPSIFLSDGPHGLRKQEAKADHLGINDSVPATCFPTAATMACSWDPSLGEALGSALGEEAAAYGVNVVLGPGLNMKRSPLCGRNFEYFSEDPYLAGKMAAAYIRGIQSRGVAACPKHFAVNSQETLRLCVDEVVDERTLREIYLTGFEIAVREAKPKCIMSSYNRVNGTYANENAHLLTDILRKEWGFEGFVMSDWGADNDHAAGILAGSALTMPYPGVDAAMQLTQAVRDGRVPESALDDRLREYLNVALSVQAAPDAPKAFDPDSHHTIARDCAAASIVLLENDGLLPLNAATRTAVIGAFAETPRFQGAGSSQVNPTKLETLKDCLAASGLRIVGYAPGFSLENPDADPDLMAQAITLAASAETVILCVGLDDRSESEGFDRKHMRLPDGQLALAEAVARVNPNVVLVLCGGSPFILPRGSFRAVIHGYLGGQAGAPAMADVLSGKLSPSGKLAESWPLALADTPCAGNYPSVAATAEHREGLYIGYRYYDTVGLPIRYPFGHGLSYTTFRYSDLHADSRSVTFTLTNTGSVDGAEIAQVYISCPGGEIFRPKKELKGFQKVFLKAGESQTVTIALDDKAFRYFNVQTGRFEVESADYEVMVAASVSDIRLIQTLHISGTEAPAPYGSLPSYSSGRIREVSDEEFAALLGHPVPDSQWPARIHRGTPVCHLNRAKSALIRCVHRLLAKKAAGGDFMMVMAYSMPIRSLENMAMKEITGEMVDDVVYMANGHSLTGLFRLLFHGIRGKKRSAAFLRKLTEDPRHKSDQP